MSHDALVEAVRASLTPELLRRTWRDYAAAHPEQPSTTGHCYVAAEALYYLLGDERTQWQPHVVGLTLEDGSHGTHWFLVHRRSGEVLDPTWDQFTEEERDILYATGRPAAWVSSKRGAGPSKRARVVMERVQRGGAARNPALSREDLYWTGVELGVAEAVKALRAARRSLKPRTYHAEVQRGYQDTIDRIMASATDDIEV